MFTFDFVLAFTHAGCSLPAVALILLIACAMFVLNLGLCRRIEFFSVPRHCYCRFHPDTMFAIQLLISFAFFLHFCECKHHLFYWFWYMDDDRHKQFIIQLSLCSIQDLVFFRFTPSFIGKTHCPISGIERLPEHISRFSSWYMYIETQPNSSGSEFNWTGWFFDFYTLRLVFRQNDDDWYDGLWTVQIIRDWMVSVCVCVRSCSRMQ